MTAKRAMRFGRNGRRLALLAACGLLAGLAGGAPAIAHEADGHPARVHEGACEQLGPVAFTLTGVGASVDQSGAAIATPGPVNADSAFEITVSETTLDTPLEALLTDSYAVMVYESDEQMDAISCGNVAGAMMGDTLVAGLAELGVPGHSGFALLRPEGDQTIVTILLGENLAPVSAAGGTASGDEAADHASAEGAEDDGHEAAATPAGS